MKWPTYRKDEIFEAEIGRRKGYAVATEVDQLQVLFGTMKGPRGGITDFLIVIDHSQKVEVDKVVCCNWSIDDQRVFLEDFDSRAQDRVLRTLEGWKANPQVLRTRADVVGFGKTSIPALSGGTCSSK